MPRSSPGLVVFASLLLSTFLRAEKAPFVHLQTDRQSYRLGETVWYRVHASTGLPVSVALLAADGKEAAREEHAGSADAPAAGGFLIASELSGGAFRLEARAGGILAHVVPLEVYDLVAPKLDLTLTLLGTIHFPGKPVAAVFRARDLQGRPLQRARVQYRAAFGAVVVRDEAGLTDAEGRALIRFGLPADARQSGHLAVGISAAGTEAAVAQRVFVSASVAAVDAFPEGGSIVAGFPQKLGLLVRDAAGQPAAAEGRVADDRGRTVAGFKTNALGLATATVLHEEGRTYRALIDLPAGVSEEFPLPGPGGHKYSLAVESADDGFTVDVRAAEGTAGDSLSLLVTSAGQVVSEKSVRLAWRKVGETPARTARISLKRPAHGGIGHIVLGKGNRVLLQRPVLLGAPSPVTVTLRPRGTGPLLPGKPVELELATSIGGSPVAAEVAVAVVQGEAGALPDLATRSWIEPGLSLPNSLPLDPARDPEGIDAFLLVHEATAFPAEGALAGDNGLAPPGAGKVTVRSLAPLPPPPAAPESPHRTVVRASGLERCLERAHFTRAVLPGDEAHSFRPRAAPSAFVNAAGLGRKSDRPPQDERLPTGALDARRTLYWNPRLRTDAAGRAPVTFRLNHVVSELTWMAQGRAGTHPVSGRGTLAPDQGFRTSFELPDQVLVGDVLDLLVEVRSLDGSGEPIAIDFKTPPCLKPLLRTRLTFDPEKDARRQRFIFEAVTPGEETEVRLVAARGLYEEVHARALRVTHPEVELSRGESGRGRGLQTFALKVPEDAIPGSVRLCASVAPGHAVEALESVADLVRVPTGCFEQWSSTNYVNLIVLDAILGQGEDPLVVERTYRIAKEEFPRLLSHFDHESGGFRFWEGKGPDVHATLTAVRQLALYGKLFGGLGRQELEAAIAWLELRDLPDADSLYLTLALHDLGRTWKGSLLATRVQTRTPYETALQAGCLAAWPEEWPDAAPPRESLLVPLLDRLEEELEAAEAAELRGTGFMGSRGAQLSAQFLALAATALWDGGRAAAALRCLELLSACVEESGGTQDRALAARAFSRCGGAALTQDAFGVEFTADPGGREQALALVGRARPLAFTRQTSLAPGQTAGVAVDIRSAEPQAYRLDCSYRVREPHSNPDAPFRIWSRVPKAVDLNAELDIDISIASRGSTTSSQVVARIGLPGGVEIRREEMNRLVASSSIDLWTVEDGCLDLYWSRPIQDTLHLKVPARARVAGFFRAQPAVVFPYYESGKESYAEPLALKIHNTFGIETPFDPGLRR